MATKKRQQYRGLAGMRAKLNFIVSAIPVALIINTQAAM